MTEREKALREAAKIAGDSTYNGDYYRAATDIRDDTARWIAKQILKLADAERDRGTAGQ